MRKSELINAVEALFGPNRIDFSQVPEKFSKLTHLTFRCKLHSEEFSQTPHSILKGLVYCPECLNEQSQEIVNDYLSTHSVSMYDIKIRTAEFVGKYLELHPDTIYDFSESMYIIKDIPIKVYCKKHQRYFWIKPSNMLYLDSKCPHCAKETRVYLDESERQKLENKFIQESRELYGDLYDYSKVHYVNTKTPVEIICKKHNKSFFKRPSNHILLKQGCPYCKFEESHSGFKFSFEEFVQEARAKYGDKYEYNENDYVNMTTEIGIYCKVHNHHFRQKPFAHLNNMYGCPLCAKDEIGRSTARLTTEMFIERSKEIFGENTFDYSRVEYKNIDTPVELFCNIHKVWFKVIPEKHLCRHQGCPHCSDTESYLERDVRVLLEQNNIKYVQEKKFDWLVYETNMRLDFYLEEYNVAIECQGMQHFIQSKNIWSFTPEKLKMIQTRDRIKNEQCKKHNVRLIYYAPQVSNEILENYELGHIITSNEELLNEIMK